MEWISNSKVKVLESPIPELVGKWGSFNDHTLVIHSTGKSYIMDSKEWHIEIHGWTGSVKSKVAI